MDRVGWMQAGSVFPLGAIPSCSLSAAGSLHRPPDPLNQGNTWPLSPSGLGDAEVREALPSGWNARESCAHTLDAGWHLGLVN